MWTYSDTQTMFAVTHKPHVCRVCHVRTSQLLLP